MFKVWKNLPKFIPQDTGRIMTLQKCHSRIIMCKDFSNSSAKKEKESLFPALQNNVSKCVEYVPFLDSIRNKFLIYGIIQPTIDPKFCEFAVCNENLKKLVFVCHRISEKDFESIEDSKYVVENFLHQLVTNSSQFSSRQRERLKSVKEEDFMDAYIHRIDIFKEKNNNTRHVKVDCTMTLLPGVGEGVKNLEKGDVSKHISNRVRRGQIPIIVSCGFIRDYSKNVKNSSWRITGMNFFRSMDLRHA